MATPVNPTEEIFWSKVREAYDLVTTNAEQIITVTVGDKEATVCHNYDKMRCISIEITEVVPESPTLVVP